MKLNNLKPTGKVICGFPGVGKSTLFEQLKDSGTKVLDSDSSKFDKTKFPDNYIKHIKESIADGYTVLASSHDTVRDALIENKMPFVLVYPSPFSEEEYLKRYKKRGSSQEFIDLLKKNFLKWVRECDAIESELITKIRLKDKEFIGWNKKIKSILNLKKPLNEMTMRTGSLHSDYSSRIESSMKYLELNGSVVGYESTKPILEFTDGSGISYGIVNDDKVTSMVSGNMVNVAGKKYFQLMVFYSLIEYKNKGDITRLLFFIKHHVNHSIIFYGSQTPEAISSIDGYASGNRFKVKWLNDKTGEEQEYLNNDKRSNVIMNDWKVVLEQDDAAENNRFERWGDTVLSGGALPLITNDDGM